MSNVTRVEKPWGYELHWAKTERYVGKLIHINKGHALSLQYHNIKDETIFLWSGKMLFEVEEDGKLVGREMQPGESVHVTPKTVHRMTAVEDSDVFEVSTPEYRMWCAWKTGTAERTRPNCQFTRRHGGRRSHGKRFGSSPTRAFPKYLPCLGVPPCLRVD
jgi:quercetin dioxygenase-like cupin family protein